MRLLEEQLFKDGFAFVARHFPRRSLHDNAVLTYLYARRRIGVAVKGPGFRLRDPLPDHAEETLAVFRNFVRFVEAKRDGVKYSPDQPRVPAGNRDGGQWTNGDGGGGGSSGEADGGGDDGGDALPVEKIGFTKEERAMTAQEFISENCEARILRVFPSEYLGSKIGEILNLPSSAKKKTCTKLLGSGEYRKEK